MKRGGPCGLNLFLLSLSTSAFAGSDAWLIMPEEAAMAPASEERLLQSRGLSEKGPTIDVVKPAEGGEVPSPLEILIRFAARTEAVDVSSLKVSLLKVIPIDITDRVRPYATAKGIDVKEAKIPAGKHRVRISVGDTTGGISTREVLFEVR